MRQPEPYSPLPSTGTISFKIFCRIFGLQRLLSPSSSGFRTPESDPHCMYSSCVTYRNPHSSFQLNGSEIPSSHLTFYHLIRGSQFLRIVGSDCALEVWGTGVS
ncbi:hypothetical protein ABKN59_009663 [Abortiporus biennis]